MSSKYPKPTTLQNVVSLSLFVLVLLTAFSMATTEYMVELISSNERSLGTNIFLVMNVIRMITFCVAGFTVIGEGLGTRKVLFFSIFVEIASIIVFNFVLNLFGNRIILINHIISPIIISWAYFNSIKCNLLGKPCDPYEDTSSSLIDNDDAISISTFVNKNSDPEEIKRRKKIIKDYYDTNIYRTTKTASLFRTTVFLIIFSLIGYYTYKFTNQNEKLEANNLVSSMIPTKTYVRAPIKNATKVNRKLSNTFSNKVLSNRALGKKQTSYELGHVYMAKNMYIQAVKEFEKAAKSRNLKVYHKTLARYYLTKLYETKLDDPKRALNHWIEIKKMPSPKSGYQVDLPESSDAEISRLKAKINNKKP